MKCRVPLINDHFIKKHFSQRFQLIFIIKEHRKTYITLMFKIMVFSLMVLSRPKLRSDYKVVFLAHNYDSFQQMVPCDGNHTLNMYTVD